MKVSCISTGVHRYNGVWLKPGDPFETDNEQDAEDLAVMGFAKREKGTYQTRDMQAAPVGEPPRTKRAYHRRDLSASK